MLQELNTDNFEKSIKEGIKIVVFTASCCGYCQMQKPILKEIAEQNIWIGEVDSDKNQDLVHKYDIGAFPTFVLFKDGDVLAKFSGYKSKYDLLNILLDYLK